MKNKRFFSNTRFTRRKAEGKIHEVNFLGYGVQEGTLWMQDKATRFKFYCERKDVKRWDGKLWMEGSILNKWLDLQVQNNHEYRLKSAKEAETGRLTPSAPAV